MHVFETPFLAPADNDHDQRMIWSQILILFDPVLDNIECCLSHD